MATKDRIIPTKAEMTKIARRARQYGHYQPTEWEAYVRCPQCSRDVTAYRSAVEKHSGVTWAKALDAVMLAHLPACTVMVAARDGKDLTGVDSSVLVDAEALAPFNSPEAAVLRAAYGAPS